MTSTLQPEPVCKFATKQEARLAYCGLGTPQQLVINMLGTRGGSKVVRLQSELFIAPWVVRSGYATRSGDTFTLNIDGWALFLYGGSYNPEVYEPPEEWKDELLSLEGGGWR